MTGQWMECHQLVSIVGREANMDATSRGQVKVITDVTVIGQYYRQWPPVHITYQFNQSMFAILTLTFDWPNLGEDSPQ